MRVRRISFLVIAASLATSPSVRADGDEGEDVAGPYAWRAGPKTIFLRRIVDASTGKPVAGATVKVFPEVPHPEPGFGTPAATGTSDANGWVRIEADALDAKIVDRYGPPTWSFVDAKGFAAAGEMAELVPGTPPLAGTEWEIEPGETVRVALVDPLDRPVPGVLVGWLHGCGHTPDERQSRTGADGVAVFESASTSADGRFWPVADGLFSPTGYVETPYAAGESPRVARLAWSQTVEGTILGTDGKPAVGVAIGFPSWHRGPWTTTDREGRFRLVGSEVRTEQAVLVEAGEYPVAPHAPDANRVTMSSFPAPPPGRKAIVRLRAPGSDPPEPPSEPNVTVDVARSSWPASTAKSSTRVVLVRESDGWTVAAGGESPVRLAAFPGTYEVLALSTSGGFGVVHSRASTKMVVPETGTAQARVDLPPPAIQPLEIEWPEVAPFLDEVALVVEGASTPIPNEGAKSIDLPVPTDVDAFLRVTQGARTRLVPLDRKTLRPGAMAPLLRVGPFPKVRAKARLVDEEGRPVPGWLFPPAEPRPEEETPPKGVEAVDAPSVAIGPGDALRVIAWPRDDERLAPRFVDVPDRASPDAIDLGEVRFARRAQPLTVRRPLRGSTEILVRVTRGERTFEHRIGLDEGPSGDLARLRDPWWRPGLLGEGSIVRVAPDSTEDRASAPVVRRLEGPGPWTVDVPSAAIEIAVADDRGASLAEWTARLDDVAYAGAGPRLELSALVPGPHEAIVDAKGRFPRRLRFTLAEGERRAWKAVLRAAPEPPR